MFDVDATDPAAPVLTATQALVIPNFAGQSWFDGVDDLFVPFRESSASNPDRDVFCQYHLEADVFSEANCVTVADDPFGLTFSNGHFYLVSENVLSVLDTDLAIIDEIDLTTAQTSGLDDANPKFVEAIAVNADATRALVSNRSDNIFVIDLASGEVVQVVDGPLSTRDMLVDANDPSRVYVVDSNAEAISVFDFDFLPDATNPPEALDDSKFLLASLGVGQDPNGLAMDATTNRLYVGNSFDDTISVIDVGSLGEIARISLNANDLPDSFVRDIQDPVALTVGVIGDESYLFVAGFTSNSIAMIRLSDLEVVRVYPDNDLHFTADPRDDD